MQALIGCTGFIGSWLARVEHFDLLINRANVETLEGRRLDRIVCAGLPAAKWIANRQPAEDLANLRRLERVLATVEARSFVLISTIDVYPRATAADEDFDCEQQPNHAYGTHRLQFEMFVREWFPNAHVVRLPAMFGPGLRKNVLFDLLHDNELAKINPDSRFQWYPLTRLLRDIQIAESAQLPLVNLFTEPVETRSIVAQLFPAKEVGQAAPPPVHYDLQTRHGKLFGGDAQYVMRRDAVMSHLSEFVDRARAPS